MTKFINDLDKKKEIPTTLHRILDIAGKNYDVIPPTYKLNEYETITLMIKNYLSDEHDIMFGVTKGGCVHVLVGKYNDGCL